MAERLGRPLSAAFDVYDLVIVGAGPAGLAAAVYGASEGPADAPARSATRPADRPGRARASRTTSGFPTGVSGSDLTRRAITQAQRLGAEFLAPLEVTGRLGRRRVQAARARPTDASWSRGPCSPRRGCSIASIPLRASPSTPGAGVYYGAATTEAPAFRGRRVLVVGGGNSAGQGAMHLARYARGRADRRAPRGPAGETMSQYLIDQIGKTPNIRAAPSDGDRGRRGRRPRAAGDAPVRWTTDRAGPKTPTRSSSSSGRAREATGSRPACCATPRDSSSRDAT